MKRFIKAFSMIMVVVILCTTFADQNILWSDDIYDRVSDMTTDDIEISIVDEDTVRVENLIQGDDLFYKWAVKNYAYGTTLGVGARLLLEDNYYIEITYEDLTQVEIQAVVSYNGYTYTSNTFYINEDGSVYQSSEEDTSTVEATDSIARDTSDIVSLAFVCFLAVLVCLYYMVPKRFQWLILLGGSTYFYTLSGVQYMIFILASSLVTFFVAKKIWANRKAIELEELKKSELKAKLQKVNRPWLGYALIATVGVMGILKYTDFVLGNVNLLLGTNVELMKLVMPLGLSFYTFMLIAYLMDVYRGKYQAEEKFSRFFLFVSFFPQVSQGPISRYDQLSPQLREHHRFDYDNFCRGAQRILWGFFVKLVLADRLAILVNWVYDSYATQNWAAPIAISILL